MNELVIKLTKEINYYNSTDASRRSGVLSTDQLYYIKEKDLEISDENDKVRIYLTPDTEEDEDNEELYVKFSDIKGLPYQPEVEDLLQKAAEGLEQRYEPVNSDIKNNGVKYHVRIKPGIRYFTDGNPIPLYMRNCKLYYRIDDKNLLIKVGTNMSEVVVTPHYLRLNEVEF